MWNTGSRDRQICRSPQTPSPYPSLWELLRNNDIKDTHFISVTKQLKRVFNITTQQLNKAQGGYRLPTNNEQTSEVIVTVGHILKCIQESTLYATSKNVRHKTCKFSSNIKPFCLI